MEKKLVQGELEMDLPTRTQRIIAISASSQMEDLASHASAV